MQDNTLLKRGNLPILVISTQDAFKLLSIKYILPHRTTVNMHGKVTAVSEIVRINKDSVFLVELEGCMTIVVKQPQFQKWHKVLEIGKPVIFTSMRPTTMSKNYNPTQRVFVPWTASRVIPLTDEVDQSNVSFVSLQEWLESLGLSSPVDSGQGVDGDKLNDTDVIVADKLLSYQGIVTDTSQSKFQIFMLNREVKLFLCFLPTLYKPCKLQVGDQVTVNNAHQSFCSGERRLFCCMKSSIHIQPKNVNAAGEKTDKLVDGQEPSVPPLQLLSQFAFRQNELYPLLQLFDDVCQVLGKEGTQSNSKVNDNLREILQQLVSSSLASGDGLQPRNYILEFCQHQTFCPLNFTEHRMVGKIPRLKLLTELIEDFPDARDENSAVTTCSQSSSDAAADDTWTYRSQSVKDEKCLLGWLTTSVSSGHLQFASSQTAISVVIASPDAISHQCNASCGFSNLSVGEKFRCPLVHPCCLGHLIIVLKYTFVTETFCCTGKENLGNGVNKTLTYLCFSPKDCVLVKRGDSPVVVTYKEKTKCSNTDTKHKIQSDKMAQKQSPHSLIKFVYITGKHYPCVQKVNNNKSSYSQSPFYADGVIVTAKDCQCDGKTGQSDSKIVSLPDKQGKCDQGESCTAKGMDNNQKTPVELHSGMSQEISSAINCVNKDDFSVKSDTAVPKCTLAKNVLLFKQPVSLRFKDENCRWFDLIHPPGLYRFASTQDVEPLLWPQMDKKLPQALERAGTRLAVSVSSAVFVDRMFDCCLNNNSSQTISSLQSALSSGSVGLLSFRGHVIWRKHLSDELSNSRPVDYLKSSGVQNMALCNFLGSRNLCIGVGDLDDSSVTSCVYIRTSAMTYPLGLLPGVVVDFHCLERKISKANRTYFNFLPVSGLNLICGHEDRQLETVQLTKTTLQPATREDTPTQLLIDLWRNSNPFDLFIAGCHLCQFFRVSLKSACTICGSLFYPLRCSASACGNTESHIVAKMSVLVDDGSSQALVNVSKNCPPDVPRKLLLMSQNQWMHLEKALQKQGELFLQKFGCKGSTEVEDLISLLCDSREVKRPCWLLLRKPASFDRKYPQQDGVATPALQSLTFDELIQRKINTGELTVETFCLPYMQLDCLDIIEM